MRAVGDVVADAAAVGGVLDGLAVGVDLAPGEVALEHAALGQLGGEGQGAAEGDGVHAEVVGQDPELDDRGEVEDADVGAQHADGLELGALPLALRQLHVAAAVDGAGDAAVVLEEQLVAHLLAGEVDALEVVPGLEVARRDDVAARGGHDQVGGAELGQDAAGHGVLLQELGVLLLQLLERLAVGDGDLALPVGDDRLQVLRAHDRAHAGAAREAGLRHDGGVADPVLAGRADDRLAVALGERRLRRGGVLAPEVRRRP